MTPDQDNSATLAHAATDEPIAAAGDPDCGAQARPPAGLLRGLRTNLLCGLRLAFFRRITLDRLNIGVEQLIALAAIDLILAFAFDVTTAGLQGRFNLWGLPGTLFYLPLTLLAGYLIARIARQPHLALALPIALLSAQQYVSIAAIALSPLSGMLDLTHSAVYFAYYWGPFLWWVAIASFAVLVLVPGRLIVKLAALGLVGLLVLMPTWMLPRASVGTLWIADDDASDPRDRYDALASEEAFYAQPELLRRALSAIAPGTRGRTHLYFVGVAGYADEDVFQKELDVISRLMRERFGTAGRSIRLINNPATALSIPLASRTSLSRTLARIGKVMNRDEDVLFLYLTSHGSEDHRFALSFWPLRLRDLDPPALASDARCGADSLAYRRGLSLLLWRVHRAAQERHDPGDHGRGRPAHLIRLRLGIRLHLFRQSVFRSGAAQAVVVHRGIRRGATNHRSARARRG